MDHNIGAQSAIQLRVGKANGLLQKGFGVRFSQLGNIECGGKHLGCFGPRGTIGIQLCEQKRIPSFSTERFGPWVVRAKAGETIHCTGVIQFARLRMAQNVLQGFHVGRFLVPVLRHHQDLTGHTVEAGVMQLLGRHLFGLKFHIGVRPRTRHHNGGAHSTQLGGNVARVQGRVGGLIGLSHGTRPPNDCVVRCTGACDVDGLYQCMVAKVLAHIGRSAHDAQKATINQGFERRAKELHQVVIDRVHLQHDHFVFCEQLVEHIEWRNGRNIAGTQYQRQFARLVGRAGGVVDRRGVLRQIRGGHPRLHPHIDLHATQQQVVPNRVWQYPRDHLTIG